MAIWPKKPDPAPVAAPSPAAAPEPDDVAAHAPASPAGDAAEAPPLPPEVLKNAAAASKAMMAAFGQVVTILLRTQDHRGKPLADLEWLAMPAVSTGQFALAEAQSKTNGMIAPVGLLMWASVSPEVDARLRADISHGVRLQPSEWRSGEILWVVEAVGDPKILQAMLQRAVNNEWKGRSVNLRMRDQDGTLRVGVMTARADQPL